jgi:hypothetical protein
MGHISNEKEFVEVRVSLEDLFKSNGQAITFVLASLATWFLQRHAPDLFKTVRIRDKTIANWAFADGEFAVAIGKQGLDEQQVKQAINQHLKQYRKDNPTYEQGDQ